MRISDWSADVCSSDLIGCTVFDAAVLDHTHVAHRPRGQRRGGDGRGQCEQRRAMRRHPIRPMPSISMMKNTSAISAKTSSTHVRHSAEKRSEEHTSELQSLMRISYAVFCLQQTNPLTVHHLAVHTYTP